MVLITALFAYVTPIFQDKSTKNYPFYYYLIYLMINLFSSIANFTNSVSLASFYSLISDRSIGGNKIFIFINVW